MVTGALSTLPARQTFLPSLRQMVWQERSAPEVITSVGRLVLVAVSGVCLAPVVWAVILALVASPNPVSQTEPRAAVPPQDFSIFDRFDPFADRKAGPTTTNINMRLFAVRMNGPKGPSAIMAVEGAPQRPFFVGDEIAPGVSLKSVSRGRVEIQTDKGLQTVDMAAPGTIGAGTRQGQAAPVNVVQTQPEQARAAGGGVNAIKLLAEIQLVARRSQDQINGYIVLAQKEAPELAKTGLQNGDVIVKINGVPVANGGRIEGLTDTLAGGGSVQVTYERSGAEYTSVLQAGRNE